MYIECLANKSNVKFELVLIIDRPFM